MKSVSWEFGGAGVQRVVSAAPSGTRYVVTGLVCDASTVAAYHGPNSGIPPSGKYTSVSAAGPIDDVLIYPSGNTGYAEGIYLVAGGACTATVSYILEAPAGKEGYYSYNYVIEKRPGETSASGYYSYVNDGRSGDGQRKWPEVVQSGSLKSAWT